MNGIYSSTTNKKKIMYDKLEGDGEVQGTLSICLFKHNAKNIRRRGGLAPPLFL